MDIVIARTAANRGSAEKEGAPVNSYENRRPGGWFGRYFGVAARPQTYLNLAYLLLGLPVGVAYFVMLVVGVSVAGSLAITLVGIPLLIGVMYGWCVVAGFDRVLTNVLLGTAINPLPFDREHGAYWSWQRIRARLSNSATWRSFIHLLVRFPQGLATFIAATVLVFVPFALIAMPVSIATGAEVNLGRWELDSWWQGAPFVLPGILLIPAALYLTNLLAWLSGKMTVAFLGTPSQGAGAAAMDAAIAAAASWRGLAMGRTFSIEAARRQAVQLRVFFVHAGIFIGAALFFIILNGLTTPGTWWAQWPIWGFAMLFCVHAGYLAKGPFGAHVGLFAVINLGLFVIDASYSGTTWFFYPLLVWGSLLLLQYYGGKRILQAAEERARLNFREGQPVEPARAVVAEAAPTGTLQDAEPPQPAATPLSADGRSNMPAITIDVVMRVVTVGGREVELTPKEFDLLALFAQNPGRPFSRDELLDRIWKNDYEVTDRTIDTHVLRLRKKLGEQSEAIQTVWGVGYKFQAAAP